MAAGFLALRSGGLWRCGFGFTRAGANSTDCDQNDDNNATDQASKRGEDTGDQTGECLPLVVGFAVLDVLQPDHTHDGTGETGEETKHNSGQTQDHRPEADTVLFAGVTRSTEWTTRVRGATWATRATGGT